MNWSELLLFGIFPCLLMLGVSVAYFKADATGSSMTRRITTSAHGAVAAALYACSMLIAMASSKPQPDLAISATLLYAVPVSLVIASLATYRGPKRLHMLQLL